MNCWAEIIMATEDEALALEEKAVGTETNVATIFFNIHHYLKSELEDLDFYYHNSVRNMENQKQGAEKALRHVIRARENVTQNSENKLQFNSAIILSNSRKSEDELNRLLKIQENSDVSLGEAVTSHQQLCLKTLNVCKN